MTLRLLYIVPPTGVFAGIERVIDEIAHELTRSSPDGFQVDVLYTCDFPSGLPQGRGYRTMQETAKGPLSLVRAVRKTAAKAAYDLIIVPQIEPTAAFWFASLGLKRRFVAYLHGNPKMEEGHFKARVLFFLMRRFVVRRLAGVIGCSHSQIDYAKTAFPGAPFYAWVPNPVRRFSRADEARPPAGRLVTFVSVGRFAYQKGHDLLLAAFKVVHEQRPQTRLRLVGHGAGEGAIRTQIEALGLSEAVKLDHLPNSPETALLESDIYVSTSRWEGWSLAICEGLRFGLPVAATDCEFGPRDILVDPRLGRLSPVGDHDALVANMLYYVDRLEEERAHADHRRRHIARFDVERVAQVHAKALRDMVALG